MIAPLLDAAREGDASAALLDELALRDARLRVVETVQQATERGWRMIRAHRAVPSDRVCLSPHVDFMDGGLSAEDVDEFLDSLDAWRAGPSATRFFAEAMAIRALAHNGYLDVVEEPLARFTAFVAELHSNRALRWLAELHGTVARIRHDWVEAAQWYDKVVHAGDGRLRTWLDVAAAWHLLIARCLGPEEVLVTGAELREPWECLRNEHLDRLKWHGATSTAIALQRLGRPALAGRFADWVYVYGLGDAANVFGEVLEIAGLPNAQVHHDDDLDSLIDELFAVADEIDHEVA
jgi:hypothetical protein